MSYPDRLASLRKIQKRPGAALTEPTKAPFGSFVSTEPGPSAKTSHPEAIQRAAEAADMQPDTLVALLSPEDHADLDAGLLTPGELAAYARSVSARWTRGYVLADEAELVTAERVRRDPLADLPLMREDRMFVARCTVGRADQHDLLTEYRARWLAAAEAEGNEIKSENAGRRAANAWLRSLSTSHKG